MPVAWCYLTKQNQKFCSTGFPMGCFVDEHGEPKDACQMNVRVQYLFKSMQMSTSVVCSESGYLL